MHAAVDLRALRLNCLLAPLTLAGLGLAVLAGTGFVQARATAEADAAEATAQVAAWGHLDQAAALRLAEGDPRWTAVAVVHLEGDRLVTDAQAGDATALPREPTPDLVAVVHGPRSWQEGDRLTAVSLLPARPEALPRLLIATRPVAVMDLRPWLTGAAVLAGLGVLLAWYLARRIYRPVEWLTREAQAALDGRPPAADASASEETEVLRSSVVQLAARYRSSTAHGPTGDRA